jgi:lysophospholipase L1-like esterase
VSLARALARWGGRLALTALGAGLGLAAAELTVRAVDPYGASYHRDTHRYLLEAIRLPPEAARPDGRLFENAPARELVARTSTFSTDGAGLRAPAATDALPTLPRAAASDVGARILFLGDSVTLGWGVDHADTWVARLEDLARAPGGGAVETLNAGHLQYTTVQEVDWFLSNGVRLEPDVVVLVPVVNDLEDNFALFQALMSAEQERAGRGPTLAERLAGLASRHLHGLRSVAAHRRAVRAAAVPAPDAGVPIEEREAYRACWPRTRAALDALAAACSERGTPLLVLDHTVPRLPGYRAWCEERGVPWYDFTFTAEERAQGVENSAADAHANPRGNAFLAEKALAALAAEGHVQPVGGAQESGPPGR